MRFGAPHSPCSLRRVPLSGLNGSRPCLVWAFPSPPLVTLFWLWNIVSRPVRIVNMLANTSSLAREPQSASALDASTTVAFSILWGSGGWALKAALVSRLESLELSLLRRTVAPHREPGKGFVDHMQRSADYTAVGYL